MPEDTFLVCIDLKNGFIARYKRRHKTVSGNTAQLLKRYTLDGYKQDRFVFDTGAVEKFRAEGI